jgi:transposase
MIRRHHPNALVELWAQDEARLGLVPIVRRVWAQRGKRPIASNRRRYEWVYVYAFTQPSTGRVYWLLLPTVNADLFQLALEDFAKSHNINTNHRVVLVLDGAGWHRAKQLKIPEGIHCLPLPAYSPELQPAERLWPLLRESVSNIDIKNIDELEEKLTDRCNVLSANRDIIFQHTNFSWWKHAALSERLCA